jgi:hypothetical protein
VPEQFPYFTVFPLDDRVQDSLALAQAGFEEPAVFVVVGI